MINSPLDFLNNKQRELENKKEAFKEVFDSFYKSGVLNNINIISQSEFNHFTNEDFFKYYLPNSNDKKSIFEVLNEVNQDNLKKIKEEFIKEGNKYFNQLKEETVKTNKIKQNKKISP